MDEDAKNIKSSLPKKKILEAHLNSLFENSPEAIVMLDTRNRVIRINQGFTELFGYEQEEIEGVHIDSLIAGEEYREEADRFSHLAEKGGYIRAESIRFRKDGSPVDVSVMGAPVLMKGEVIGLFGIYQDIGERKRVERALAASEQRYRNLIEEAPIGIFQSSSRGYFLTVNKAVAGMLGFEKPKDVVNYYRDLAHTLYKEPKEREHFLDALREHGEVKNLPLLCRRKDSSDIWLSVNARLSEDLEDGEFVIDGFITDTSALRKTTESLERSIGEKEVLLQEVHHRVKNNMQIFSSILNLESDRIDDRSTKELIVKSQNRIRAMSLIHEKLYHSEEVSKVNLCDYTENLCREIINFTAAVRSARPKLEFELQELYTNIDFAIPFGLIVSEILMNAHKHAFEGIPDPRIWVGLKRRKNAMRLEIRDNGIGFPEGLDIEETDSLGLQLLRSLTEQLAGTLELASGRGTYFLLTFPFISG